MNNNCLDKLIERATKRDFLTDKYSTCHKKFPNPLYTNWSFSNLLVCSMIFRLIREMYQTYHKQIEYS